VTTLAAPQSLWSPHLARRWQREVQPPELGLRVYASRLLGDDPSLVFAGGGNTSVKTTVDDLFGEPVEALFVKASGAELAEATAASFTALDLSKLRRLVERPSLTDTEMARALLAARLDSAAPAPSVEALLHALVPHRFVDHAHPDALLATLSTPDGAERARDLYGADCLVVPYVKPGFDLARACRDLWREAGEEAARWRGLVLLGHGVVAFADDARTSYETLLELVGRAARLRAPRVSIARRARPARLVPLDVARLRHALSRAAGRPMLLARVADRSSLAFLDRHDLRRIVRRGPLTPDHVIRTKRVPLVVSRASAVGAAVQRYAETYRAEFERRRKGRDLVAPDPAPRVVLVPGTGIFGVGASSPEAATAAEIYRRTARASERAEAFGGWRPIGPQDVFEMETWELEQAKLGRPGAPPSLDGRIALVTGAASGIGRATAQRLLAEGAAVVGLDLATVELDGAFVAVRGDATRVAVVRRAVETAVERFGGLDVVVANAGVFFAGPRIEAIRDADWKRTLELNLDAQLKLLREAVPYLRESPGGGSVVVVGSKNVAAPGPGAAAYSVSKAALTQLARVAALELAPDGVRVNVVHPDAVFDTGVWKGGRLEERAASYGLSVEAYRKRNLLAREVRSRDVAALVVALAGDLFAHTTGAQIPVDGGNERVI